MILHIDMDAFYASVEQLDNPRLKGECVIVGGLSNRSVVPASSYEARKFGVHSAMPMFQARRKCPRGIVIRPRMDRYKSVSKKIMSLLREFSPRVEVVSIDEAYVEITGCSRLHGEHGRRTGPPPGYGRSQVPGHQTSSHSDIRRKGDKRDTASGNSSSRDVRGELRPWGNRQFLGRALY